jgi:2-oxo-3-hexenedioate decarboxylase
VTFDVDAAAAALDAAQRDAEAMEQFGDRLPGDFAYPVQAALLARRLRRGERPVGVKLGFTSEAKQAQMGLSEVIVGRLTDAMAIPDGSTVNLRRYIHPRVEPEVAFRLDRDVDPAEPEPGIRSAIGAVAPAMEVIDSRYRDFRFSLADVIADNTSAAGFVVGPWTDLGDLADCQVELVIDGVAVQQGSTAAILGHPLLAADALVPIAHRLGIALPAGTVILAGAATAAVPLRPGLVEARIAGVGSARVQAIDG